VSLNSSALVKEAVHIGKMAMDLKEVGFVELLNTIQYSHSTTSPSMGNLLPIRGSYEVNYVPAFEFLVAHSPVWDGLFRCIPSIAKGSNPTGDGYISFPRGTSETPVHLSKDQGDARKRLTSLEERVQRLRIGTIKNLSATRVYSERTEQLESINSATLSAVNTLASLQRKHKSALQGVNDLQERMEAAKDACETNQNEYKKLTELPTPAEVPIVLPSFPRVHPTTDPLRVVAASAGDELPAVEMAHSPTHSESPSRPLIPCTTQQDRVGPISTHSTEMESIRTFINGRLRPNVRNDKAIEAIAAIVITLVHNMDNGSVEKIGKDHSFLETVAQMDGHLWELVVNGVQKHDPLALGRARVQEDGDDAAGGVESEEQSREKLQAVMGRFHQLHKTVGEHSSSQHTHCMLTITSQGCLLGQILLVKI
jgi:hypothetical protein